MNAEKLEGLLFIYLLLLLLFSCFLLCPWINLTGTYSGEWVPCNCTSISPPPTHPKRMDEIRTTLSSIIHMSFYCIRWFQRTLFRMHGCFGWKYDGFHGRCLTCLMYCSCWMHWFIQDNLRCWMISCMECPSINVGT